MASADLSIEAARAAVVQYGQRLVADRLVYGSAGNLSIRIGDKVVMSPSGLNYDQITEEHVNVLSADGTILEGTGRRSSEWPMHRRVYDLSDAGAVIHTHSPFGVAVGTLWDEIPAVHYSVLRLGGPTVRVAGYTTFGSDGLAENVAAALEDRFACLLQNHGAVAYGADIAEAYDRVQLIEWMAEVYWRARLAGAPRILSAEELAAVSEAARQHRYHDRGRP
ncbi:MAG TPA: class II aldolase/adducin family protein [Streptosporangiaceae bacterium]|nr:class II aldolase/adducin family protein [Streptosporangiaceae bacterium]